MCAIIMSENGLVVLKGSKERLMDLTRIEVEYRVYQQKQNCSDLPAEFQNILLRETTPRHARSSRLLLLLAETLIRTGHAIKDSQRAVSEQHLYS